MVIVRILILGAAFLLGGCGTLPEGTSNAANPLGWPARVLATTGFHGANTEVPLIEESGRLLLATGELIDSPACLFEGIATLDGSALRLGVEKLFTGTGGTLTAAINLPFFFVPARRVDLGREADVINLALTYLEELPPEKWRYYDGDERSSVFPKGARVRPSGRNLIWTLPGGHEIVQTAKESPLFRLGNLLSGNMFGAQERSWGFVVDTRAHWDKRQLKNRVVTILHEFYHQHMQMRSWLRGWTVIYWPAYGVTFPFSGWEGHWAEVEGVHAAYIVDQGLRNWRPLLNESKP